MPILNVLAASLCYGYNVFTSFMYGVVILIVAIVCCKTSMDNQNESAVNDIELCVDMVDIESSVIEPLNSPQVEGCCTEIDI